MAAFVEIPSAFLRSIATDSDRVPQLYYCGNAVSSRIFWMRLRWLFDLARELGAPHETCLDFGSGGGILLPSLASLYRGVVAIDLEVREAAAVVDRYALDNVELVQADVLSAELAGAPFDAVVAADVLEHFRDLDGPVRALYRWLRPGGLLLTSLPTESGLYDRLRRLYGMERPPDHYHTGFEVEAFLAGRGFRRARRRFVPLRWNVAPLYLVTAWRREDDDA